MRKPAYFERNGCIYVAFNATSLDAGLPPCETEPPETLLTDFMRDWLQIMASQIRHNTLDSYWHMFNRHIEPFFGVRQITVQSASLSDFQEFVDKKYQDGYSPTSIAKFHSIVHKCLRYAVSRGIIEHNPSDYVLLPKKVKYISRTFDQAQLNLFLKEAKSSPAEPAFILAATYGLRRSEAAGLRWQAIDFSAGTILINHTAISSNGKVTYSDRVKTNSSYRTLPLMQGMREYLLQLRQRQHEMQLRYGSDYHSSDYVCRRDNGKPLRPDYISQEFAKLCRKTALPHIRFHDLRHSAATLLLREGFSLKQIQEWLGHANITTTANTYAHVTYSDKLQMAAHLDHLFDM